MEPPVTAPGFVEQRQPFAGIAAPLPPVTSVAPDSTPAVTAAPRAAAKVAQQVQEWLDTPKGKLTNNQVWTVIQALPPVENYQMLLHALELLKARLNELSSNVRLLWIVQQSLETLSMTKMKPDAPVLKSVLLTQEMGPQFWNQPPVAFFKDLNRLVKALKGTRLEGTTDSFQKLVRDGDNWIKNASFLKLYIANCITVNPQDEAGLPFVDFGDLHAYLTEKRAVLWLEGSVALEVVSPTELRLLTDVKEDCCFLDTPLLKLEQLPARQRAQIKQNYPAFETVWKQIVIEGAPRAEQVNAQLQKTGEKLGEKFAAALEESKDSLTPSQEMKICTSLVGLDSIGFFEQIRMSGLDHTKPAWSKFLQDCCKTQIALFDQMSSLGSQRGDNFLGLLYSLPRSQRCEALTRLYQAFQEGKPFAPVFQPYFNPRQIDALLEPFTPQQLLKFFDKESLEGLTLLEDLHKQLESSESSTLKLWDCSYPKNSKEGKKLLWAFKRIAHCAKIIRPYVEKMDENHQKLVYLGLISTFMEIRQFFLQLMSFLGESISSKMLAELSQAYPKEIEEAKEYYQKQQEQFSQIQKSSIETMTKIFELVPPSLQGKLQEAMMMENPMLGLCNFAMQHKDQLEEGFLNKILALSFQNPMVGAMAQNMNSMSDSDLNALMEAGQKGDFGTVVNKIKGILPKEMKGQLLDARAILFFKSKIELMPKDVQAQAFEMLNQQKMGELAKLFQAHFTKDQLAEMMREASAISASLKTDETPPSVPPD